MGYKKEYISNQVDDKSALYSLNREIGDLGFDPIKEIPSQIAVYQIIEGFDVHDELLQHLHLIGKFENNPVTLSFMFCSIRDEGDRDFRLLDIQTRLFTFENGYPLDIATEYFGRRSGFPSRDQMINKTVDKATSLSRAKQLTLQFGKAPNPIKNKI